MSFELISCKTSTFRIGRLLADLGAADRVSSLSNSSSKFIDRGLLGDLDILSCFEVLTCFIFLYENEAFRLLRCSMITG